MEQASSTRRVELSLKLPQLQNLIKRDPPAYRDEFEQQYRHFTSQLSLFRLNPSSNDSKFGSLVNFLSHTTPCYPDKAAEFPPSLSSLLTQHAAVLAPELRHTLVQALILL